ncbi:MAG TPA: RpiB/LacA/LacB family sugar-phosphate isomerase [Bryobacteraceae bacterium]|nr:RpiB/LacA/LacB family sugar-phosphate isomerase [Bryobacteraceae bacterium]
MRNVITTVDVPLTGVLEVVRGTIITPSARELARDRGVPIVEVAPEAYQRARLPHRTVVIGSDHGGFRMKEYLKAILDSLGYQVEDVGAFDERPVDYPDLAEKVADAVSRGQAFAGVMVDGAGIGSAMVANKVPGIRAALCYDRASARNSREHNHANLLTLGGRMLTETQAEDVLRTWFATPWGGGRHQSRIDKITAVEAKNFKGSRG